MKQLVPDAAHGVLSTTLTRIGDTPVTLATLITMVVVVAATFIFSRLVRLAIRRALERRGVEVEHGGMTAVGRLVHYVIVLIGLGVALQTAGIKLGALFAAGAVFAVGIGFAMQNIAQNFVSGVILLVERTIKPGDVVEVEGTLVRVVEMGIRSTLVRSRDEEDMIVPNSKLVQTTVKNYTLSDQLYRLRVGVGVTYDSDMALVRSTLEQVADRIEWRDKDREPVVLMADFGSSSVDFELSVWSSDAWNQKARRSQVREAIWWALKEQGIVIAFPQLDLHLDPPVIESLGGLGKRAPALPS
jgi:small-conductance mechanosensitive channel